MLVFNEGVPGAGKTYDAVVTHILPALKKRRKVFARLNGLNHERIAAHLPMPVEDVQNLLVCVAPEQVKDLPTLAEHDALIVIDEAHTFYVADRNAMDRVQEAFFAEHRHKGQDIVIISQWYRRLHSALRARVERKAVFQKLTAVGAKNSYRVTHYQSTAPDRFEQVGGETKKYDKAIFPLYHGIAPGTKNAEVYDGGAKTIWAKIAGYAIWIVPAAGLGLYMLMRFFGPNSGLVKHNQAHASTPAQVSAIPAPVQAAPIAAQVTKRKAVDTHDMPEEVAYVFDTSERARPRLAAIASGEGGTSWGLIEWRQDQNSVIERMSLAQLRDMGMVAEVHAYGVKLLYKGHAFVVTAWPLDRVDAASTPRGTDSTVQGAYRTASAPPSSEGAGGWKENALAKAYTPPDQVRPPTRSDWKPSH